MVANVSGQLVHLEHAVVKRYKRHVTAYICYASAANGAIRRQSTPRRAHESTGGYTGAVGGSHVLVCVFRPLCAWHCILTVVAAATGVFFGPRT